MLDFLVLSHALGATQDSDVDFLVEFNCKVGLFEFIKVRLSLKDILGCAVDIGTADT